MPESTESILWNVSEQSDLSIVENAIPRELSPEVIEVHAEEISARQPTAEGAGRKPGPEPGVESCRKPLEDDTRNNHTSPVQINEESSHQQIRIRVSSKHLTLASRVFKRILQPGFREGDSLRSGRSTELPLPEDHPFPMSILLNIIHGRLREVPRIVDLCMLTEIAILVDKYELLGITGMFLDFWLPNLEATIPRVFDSNLRLWICISWVFEKSKIFKQVTRIAQLESQGPIEEKRLPIPESLLSMRQD